MAETDHVHERGRSLEESIAAYQCAYCDMEAWAEDWELYEAAIAAVSLHGLPGHAERVARVVAIAAARSLLGEEWMTVEEVIDAYLAWTKGEVEA